jgi:hypothetical protein
VAGGTAGAFADGGLPFGPGVFAVGRIAFVVGLTLFELTLVCDESVGAGDSLAAQPAVTPMPMIANPPAHSAIRLVG